MITLLIPTLNRSNFVVRYLYYLKKSRFKGCVCIGDSSDTYHLNQTRQAIEELKTDFNIIHREYPGLDIAECIRAMLPLIATPYAMYINDDDLLVVDALKDGMKFLKDNPDYSAVSGVIVHCHLKSTVTNEQILYANEGCLNVFKANSASQRLIYLLGNCSDFTFSITRSELLKKMYPSVSNFSGTPLSSVMLPEGIIAVTGNLKKLNRLFLIRQIHQQRYVLPDTYDLITRSNWLPSYQVFHDYLAQALMEEDVISKEEAHEVVKQAFWSYMNKILNKHFRYRYIRPQRAMIAHIKKAVKAVPGMVSWLRKTKTLVFPREISLEALLSRRSPYHDDFMPAYRAIVTPYHNYKKADR